MIETLILSVTSFVGTNIDDIFINTLLFSEAKNGEAKSIVVGKYLGMGALILLSLLGAFGLQFLPRNLIGYLGFVPIALGIKEIIAGIRSKSDDADSGSHGKSAGMAANAALITMANGADNIGVYIPLFAGFDVSQMILTVGVFLVLIAVWCFFGKALSDLPVLKKLISRYRKIIVPVVYMVLGMYILLKNMI